MFHNLAAEMARKKISVKDIAGCLDVSERTVKNYLNGKTKIPWESVLKIQGFYFSGLEVGYLFAMEDKSA
jgi:predicted transcriptional regulator